MLEHEPLERRAVDFGRPVERPLRPQRPEHAGIEKVELFVRHEFPPRALGENGQPRGHQQILEYFQVAVHRRPPDLAFAGDGRRHELRARPVNQKPPSQMANFLPSRQFDPLSRFPIHAPPPPLPAPPAGRTALRTSSFFLLTFCGEPKLRHPRNRFTAAPRARFPVQINPPSTILSFHHSFLPSSPLVPRHPNLTTAARQSHAEPQRGRGAEACQHKKAERTCRRIKTLSSSTQRAQRRDGLVSTDPSRRCAHFARKGKEKMHVHPPSPCTFCPFVLSVASPRLRDSA